MTSIVTGMILVFVGSTLFFFSNGSLAGSLFAVGIALIAIGADMRRAEERTRAWLTGIALQLNQVINGINSGRELDKPAL